MIEVLFPLRLFERERERGRENCEREDEREQTHAESSRNQRRSRRELSASTQDFLISWKAFFPAQINIKECKVRASAAVNAP